MSSIERAISNSFLKGFTAKIKRCQQQLSSDMSIYAQNFTEYKTYYNLNSYTPTYDFVSTFGIVTISC